MPSQNRLLGSGVPEEKLITQHIEPTHLRTPAWRFHKDFPQGKICKTDAELDKADAEGWLDHPGKVRLLPGHEKVWEAYQKSLEVTDKIDEVKERVIVEPVKSEDQIRADALKAESDKVEAKRLGDERKAEGKRIKQEVQEELEYKDEERRLAEYEEAKNPPGPRLCTLCGKTFDSLRALNMHGIGAHRNRKQVDL